MASESHPDDNQRLVNPYAASAIPKADAPIAASSREEPVRHYRARMDWSDRRAFLRSVAPLRIAAVCHGLIVVKTIYSLGQQRYLMATLPTLSGFNDQFDYFGALLDVGLLIAGLLGLYSSWLLWRLADVVCGVAGGKNATLHNWSQLHWRWTWLIAATGAYAVASNIVVWFLTRSGLGLPPPP